MKVFTVFVSVLASFGPGEFPQPGAGLEAAPHGADAQLFKDGFYFVNCVTDGMEKFADIHSDQGQKRYAAQNSNVSVVKYHLTVPKEDQVDMTPSVCFNFCRTQDKMAFFGLIHGRECYCTPYYRQESGDDSSCDLPCPGLATSMCGGKGRSSIYQMHYCGDTARELKESTKVASQLVKALASASTALGDCSAAVQEAGNTIGNLAGQVGDSAASDHAQAAREAAGTYKRAQEALDAESEKVNSGTKSLRDAAPVEQNEQIASLNSAVKDLERVAESSDTTLTKCAGRAPITDAATVLKGFYAVQKFIEGSEGDMATCEGTMYTPYHLQHNLPTIVRRYVWPSGHAFHVRRTLLSYWLLAT
eukprot:GEMP01033059.1.p1 GENE.GEMP01033059.1~~GEMP01033059.1.p1  ORF type:complete len:361 (-),score=78.25 GEMP01033059.1:886-1968(-)